MRYLICITAFILLFTNLMGQRGPVGIFKNGMDIGNPGIAGSAIYNENEQEYTLNGSGYNIWFNRDEFHYLFNEINGDFILTASFKLSGKGTEPHRKTGWMLRASTDDDSPFISATLHGDGLTVLQWRNYKGASMLSTNNQIPAPGSGYEIIQIERSGKIIFTRAAHPGEALENIGSYEMINLPDKILAGPFICSHNPAVNEEVIVHNLRIDKPAGINYNPGKDGYTISRLETMNVFDLKRKVIFEKQARFEAPNWMPDGAKLLFNMGGLLYKIPVKGGDIVPLRTGFANRINNDHGISFNGKLLAISHQREGIPGGGSTVYVLPLKGGKPELVTEQSPSYWHGWAPDNNEVIYVAKRDEKPEYNIYRKSIKRGKEIALTSCKSGEHVDGCEYSPDGKYIYYNGSHTGKMHIWRMKADGSGREEITSGEYYDWFPHVSPDGKWIVFLSFPPDIELNSHPPNKRVMLRLMPADGGEPRVIAYLYGGQGTINVPSWSPDSKQIAFVSYSAK